MRYVSWLITLAIVVVVVIFALTNREETTVWPLPATWPVWLIIMTSFTLGFLLGGIVTWFSGGRRRQRARQARERAKALARQLADLQRQQPAAPAAPLGVPALAPNQSAGSRLPAE